MGYTIEGNKITLARSNSLYCEVGMLRKNDKQPYIPEEGDKLYFALKRNQFTPSRGEFADKEPLIKKTIPIDTRVLHLLPQDTTSLPFGNYVYEITLESANGDVDTFIRNAPFILAERVDD